MRTTAPGSGAGLAPAEDHHLFTAHMNGRVLVEVDAATAAFRGPHGFAPESGSGKFADCGRMNPQPS